MRALLALTMSMLATTSAFAAAGDQLAIGTGYTSDVTTYSGTAASAYRLGVYATGVAFDQSSGLMRPVVTRFKYDGTKDTTFGTNGTFMLTDLTSDAITTSAVSVPYFNSETVKVYVTTSTSVEVYQVAITMPGGPVPAGVTISHPHTFAFPHGVIGTASGRIYSGGEVIAVSARDTAGGVVKGVLIRPGVTGFGTSGLKWIDGGTADTRLSSVSPCDNGFVCATGRARDTGGSTDVLAVKVSDSTGAFATSFDGDGKKRFSFGVAGQPNSFGNSHYMSGSSGSMKWTIFANVCGAGAVCDLGVARLSSSGALDTTFSGDGKNVFDLGGYSSTSTGITVSGTRSYVVGQVFTDSTFSNANSFIFAFTTSGNGDTAYGTNGLRTFNNYTGTGLEGYFGVTWGADAAGTTRIFAVGDRDTATGTVDGVMANHVL